MRAVRSTLAKVFAACAVVALAACGADSPSDPTIDSSMVVAKVTLTSPVDWLMVGSTTQLVAAATNPAGAVVSGEAIIWESSHPAVATVSPAGIATGIASGTTEITAKAGRKSASLTLTVRVPNRIVLASDAGDFVGDGQTFSYSNADAQISVYGDLTSVVMDVRGTQSWYAIFVAPAGRQLVAGTYRGATRPPFQGSGAGLSWSGNGRGCNETFGTFVIDSIRWSTTTASTPVALDLQFEQHCEGAPPGLHGSIHWRADDPTTPPGPVRPIPSTVWQPPSGAVPATGDVVYLQSDPGDFVGGGVTELVQADVGASGSGRHIRVNAGGYVGEFEAMNVIATVETGFYDHLIRFPYHNAVVGGLSWSGDVRGCNTLAGWFAVDRIRYVNGALAGVELRFEQRCDGKSAALRGYVRWGELTG